MADLQSPGVRVTVIDESNYLPSATNTVPYFLIATAQNKIQGSGAGVAVGTLKANANKIYLISSQRDLAATYGNPFFYKTTTGTSINGYELNEYGLLAAYSALGLTNQAYVQRVDIDLAELTASLTRPTGDPANGSYWFDTASTSWGIFEWNYTTAAFTRKTVEVITSSTQVEPAPSTLPLQSFGTIGSYAVNVTNANNPLYYKNTNNEWVLVGSDEWKLSWPTIQGSEAPTSLTPSNVIAVNGYAFTIPGAPNNTIANLVTQINAANILGVTAASVGGKLTIYADSDATSDGSTANGGIVTVENLSGNALSELGITPRSYYAPALQQSANFNVPRWRVTDDQPRPTGSVWFKTTVTNQGANLVIKRFDATLGEFVSQACPLYPNDQSANYALDPSGGGKNIAAGATYGQYDALDSETQTVALFMRMATGPTVLAGATVDPVFTTSTTFTLSASQSGSSNLSTPVTVELLGTTPADFVTAVSAAGVNYVSAGVDANGRITFTHSQGGVIVVDDTIGTPLVTAGFNETARVQPDGSYIISNWEALTYEASDFTPFVDPPTGRLWYYSDSSVADIMIKGNTDWQGYRTVTNDIRGFDLTLTNADGPIVSPTEPTTQTDSAASPLVYGDLWIDTSDLENYPKLYRYEPVNGQDQWVLIDTADQTTENGLLFADAR